MGQYFHLQALYDGSVNIYAAETQFCFEFHPLRVQPCLFANKQGRGENSWPHVLALFKTALTVISWQCSGQHSQNF